MMESVKLIFFLLVIAFSQTVLGKCNGTVKYPSTNISMLPQNNFGDSTIYIPGMPNIYSQIINVESTKSNQAKIHQSFINDNIVVDSISALIPYSYSECLAGGITFTSQSQIDNFAQNYPGCTSILGNLTIDDELNNNIQNLLGLSQINSIKGSLLIAGNSSLINLNGLNNLDSVYGSMSVLYNANLNTLEDFDNLSYIGGFIELNGNSITNLNGLSSINTIGTIIVRNSFSLSSLAGIGSGKLSSLIIDNCDVLINLSGLENRIVNSLNANISIINNNNLINLIGANITQANDLKIENNNNVVNLNGLNKLTTLTGDLWISNNPLLQNIDSLDGLKFVDFVYIKNNLSLSSINGISKLSPCSFIIEMNPQLNVCNNDFVCASIFAFPTNVFMSGNGSACSNINTLKNQCGGGSGCLSGTIILRNQTQIDTFLNGYGTCTYLNANVHINNSNLGTINNLDAFQNIKAINGYLIIDSCNTNMDFSGINKLKYLTDDFITRSNNLGSNNICDSLFVAKNITIENNFGDTLFALNQLKFTNTIIIKNNFHKYFEVLKDIIKIENDFLIVNNTKLIDPGFHKFAKATDLGRLILSNNDSLTSPNTFISSPIISGLAIFENNLLSNLDFLENVNLKDSPSNVFNLEINNNSNLSYCGNTAICSFLQKRPNNSIIDSNKIGCNNRFEIKTECNNGIPPNPVKFIYNDNSQHSWISSSWYPSYPGIVTYYPDTIVIPEGTICELDALQVYNYGAIFENYGNFNPIYYSDEHPFYNYGVFNSYPGSSINNNSPIYNYGFVSLNGTNWQMGDSLINHGSVSLDSSIINQTDLISINNYDTIVMNNNSILEYYYINNNSAAYFININSDLKPKYTVQNDFKNYGKLINEGKISLHNVAKFTNFNSSLFINNDSLILNTGSIFNLQNNSILKLDTNSILINNISIGGTNSITNSGIYKGIGFMNSDFILDSNSIISPGLSPGCTSFSKDLNIEGEINIEFNGATPCTQFDQIKLANGKNFNANGKLRINFNNYSPSIGQTFTVVLPISGSISFSGSFDTIIISPNNFQVTYSNGVITIVNVKKYYYQDLDNDGFGTSVDSIFSFSPAPSGYASNKSDCNDSNPQINPNAFEICNNSTDDNCNGQIDETMLIQGLTAWYPFHGNANDESINNNNGTVTNATLTTDRFNHPDSAYFFNGTNARIDVANNASMNHANISISTWVYYSSVPSGAIKGLVTKQYTGNSTFYIYWESGRIKAFSSNGTTSGTLVDNTTSYPTSPTWLHLAYTFDDANNSHKLYVNGILVASGSPTYSLAYNTNPVVIGAGWNGSTYANFYNGKIDDVRIYDYVFNQNQVLHVMNDVPPEVCNGVDDDCDGLVDEGVQITYYQDLDNDNFGNNSVFQMACVAPTGYKAVAGDCNDNNNLIYPGAPEMCNNSIDDNCNGQIDETMLTQGLTAWYPFHGNANDESINNNNGTVTNAILTTDRFNHPDSAYMFNGSNARIDVANNASMNHANISISTWVYYSIVPTGAIKGLVTKQYTGNSTYYLYWESGRLKAFSSNGTTSGILVDNTTTYPTSPTWLHIVYTFDDANNSHKLYVNGILVASGSPTYSLAYNTNPVVIGAGWNGSTYANFYNGKIDDVRIYAYVLTQNQVLHVMNDVTPEVCNGIDDDCDGVVDDGLNQTNSFTNNASGNSWHLNENWSLNTVPTRCHDVIIPSELISNINQAALVRSLLIETNAELHITSSGLLEVFFGNGTFETKNQGILELIGMMKIYKQ